MEFEMIRPAEGKTPEQKVTVTDPNSLNAFTRYGFDFAKKPTKAKMVEALIAVGKKPHEHFNPDSPEKAFKIMTHDK